MLLQDSPGGRNLFSQGVFPCRLEQERIPPTSRRVFKAVLSAVAIQAILVTVTTLAKLRTGSEDTDFYFRYATMILDGKIPYHDFRVEYPPLSIPLFLAAKIVSRGVAGFRVAFAIEMLIFNAGTVLIVARWVERRQGRARVASVLAWYTLFFLMLSRLVVSRYDAAPMLFGFGASVWWFSGRGVLGGLAAAVGTLMKVYPALVALIASAGDLARPRTERGKGMIAFSFTLVLGAAAWLSLGGMRGVSESLAYQAGRGFELGSLYSGAQMLIAKLLGAEIVIERDHAAWSTVTPWSSRLVTLVFPIQLAASLMVCGVYLRRGTREGVRYSGAAVLAFIVTGKVFSPQYLLWLMPYVAVLEGPIARPGRWMFAAGCAAALLAPASLNLLAWTSPWIILVFNLKNAIFLWLLALLTFGPLAGTARAGIDESGDKAPSGS